MNKILVIFFLISFISCSVLKRTTYEYIFNGRVEIIRNNESQNFKFNLQFDSLFNAEIKVYALAGIKVGNFIISDTSVTIKYLIDEDYKNVIVSEFSDINRKICLKNFIFDISTKRIDKEIFSTKCYSIARNQISKSYDVINRFSEKLFEITNIEISGRKRNRKYTVILPETIINLELSKK